MNRNINIFVFLLLISFINAMSEPLPNPINYLSPGIQIGYDFNDGFFVASQVTIGLVEFDFDNDIYPGITLGFRKYKTFSYGYSDLQFSYHYFGVGFGKYWKLPFAKNSQKLSIVKGFRAKFWIGLFVLGTYDLHKMVGKPISHSVGTIGVFPLVRTER